MSKVVWSIKSGQHKPITQSFFNAFSGDFGGELGISNTEQINMGKVVINIEERVTAALKKATNIDVSNLDFFSIKDGMIKVDFLEDIWSKYLHRIHF